MFEACQCGSGVAFWEVLPVVGFGQIANYRKSVPILDARGSDIIPLNEAAAKGGYALRVSKTARLVVWLVRQPQYFSHEETLLDPCLRKAMCW